MVDKQASLKDVLIVFFSGTGSNMRPPGTITVPLPLETQQVDHRIRQIRQNPANPADHLTMEIRCNLLSLERQKLFVSDSKD
jgi:hypothetical protein